MKASAELSLYPLDANYKSIVIDFVKVLQSLDDLEVVTNGMSTQIFGTLDNILDAVKQNLPLVCQEHPSILVIKLAPGHLRPELLPKEIQ